MKVVNLVPVSMMGKQNALRLRSYGAESWAELRRQLAVRHGLRMPAKHSACRVSSKTTLA